MKAGLRRGLFHDAGYFTARVVSRRGPAANDFDLQAGSPPPPIHGSTGLTRKSLLWRHLIGADSDCLCLLGGGGQLERAGDSVTILQTPP